MSHESHVISSNQDGVIRVSVQQKKKKSFLKACVYEYECENERFSPCATPAEYVLPRMYSILKAQSCLEIASNVCLPTILLRTRLTSSDVFYIFVISPTNSELRPIRKFSIQRTIGGEKTKRDQYTLEDSLISLIPGPTISVVCKNKFSIYLPSQSSCKESKSKSVAKNEYDVVSKEVIPVSSSIDNFHKIEIKYFGFVECVYLIIGVLNSGNGVDSCSTKKLFAFFLRTSPQSQESRIWERAELRCFIAEEYADNLSKLLVLDCSQVFMKGGEMVGGFSTVVVAATTDGYLMRFMNGKLLNCIQLVDDFGKGLKTDENAVEDLTILHSEELTDFIIVHQRRQLLSVAENDFSKVKETFERPKHALIGDFMKIGSEQLLCMNTYIDQNLSSGWLLTDFISHHFDRRIKAVGDNETKLSESLLSSAKFDCNAGIAVEALQSKLQGDRIVLHEVDKSVREKVQFLTSTLNSVANFTLPNASSSSLFYKSDLRTLVGEKKYDSCPQSLDVSEHYNENIKILETWCRIIDEMFVIGIDFENNLKRPITDVTLVVVPLTSSSDYLKASFFSKYPVAELHQSGKTGNETPINEASSNPAKRRKCQRTFLSSEETLLPGKRSCISCCISLPCFHHITKYQFSSVLSWKEANSQNLSIREEIFSQNCGLLALEYEDILKQRYGLYSDNLGGIDPNENTSLEEVFTANRDITALNTIQFCTDLTIESVTCLLHKISDILTLGGHFVYVHKYQCHLSRISMLKNCRIYVKKILSPTKVHITVCARNRDQFSTLLHHLYYILPDDVIILHDNQDQSNNICKNVLKTLTEEINAITLTNKKLLNDNSVAFTNSQSCLSGAKFGENKEGMLNEEDKMEMDEEILLLNDVIYTEDIRTMLQDHEQKSDSAVMKLVKL